MYTHTHIIYIRLVIQRKKPKNSELKLTHHPKAFSLHFVWEYIEDGLSVLTLNFHAFFCF